jgi:hypothetical protein
MKYKFPALLTPSRGAGRRTKTKEQRPRTEDNAPRTIQPTTNQDNTRTMKTRKHILPLAALAGLALASANAATIFSDDFSGLATTNLHGTTPDVTTGGATWVASTAPSAYKADGSSTTTTEGSMTLAFTPVDGTVYTLDATFENISGSQRS